MVMPLPVAEELTRTRAAELIAQLEKTLLLHITVANPQALEGKVPDFVTLSADPSMAPTDIRIVWGEAAAQIEASQAELHKRITVWLADTLELITTHKEEAAS